MVSIEGGVNIEDVAKNTPEKIIKVWIEPGEYLNDNRHGEGTATYPDGSNYDGEFLNGNKNGKGIFTLTDGTRYEVVFENDELKSNKAI